MFLIICQVKCQKNCRKNFPDLKSKKTSYTIEVNTMKLTTNKLESLILEVYNREQKRKILELIRKTRELLRELESTMNFNPPMVYDLIKYTTDSKGEIDVQRRRSKLQSLTTDPFWKPYIMKHYGAVRKIAENLEIANQYLTLFEDLEIQDNIAFYTKGMLYSLNGVTTARGQTIPFLDLANHYDIAISFLEEIQNFDPSFLGQGNMSFEGLRDTVDSFHNNYSDLKDYLDGVI